MKKVEFFSVENTVFSQLYKSSQILDFFSSNWKVKEKKIRLKLHNVSKHNKCSFFFLRKISPYDRQHVPFY